jgi:hypothetical protein
VDLFGGQGSIYPLAFGIEETARAHRELRVAKV